jgi:hypothetical protein
MTGIPLWSRAGYGAADVSSFFFCFLLSNSHIGWIVKL